MLRTRVRFLILPALLFTVALPRPSAGAIMCPISCWIQGNQTCSEAGNCHVTCCVTGSRGCVSLCDA
jgi:hypothetical protein